MAIIIDLIRKNNEHHSFNSEIISSLNKGGEENIHILDKNSSSIENIANQRLIKINVKSTKFYFWFMSNLLLLKYFFIFRKKGHKFILLSATPLQYFISSFVSNILKLKIYIFMHGELAYLFEHEGIGKKIGFFLIKKTLLRKNNVNFIAINFHIYKNIKNMFPIANFVHIEHPLQPNFSPKQVKSKDNKLYIGSFGILSDAKNSEYVYELVRLLSSFTFEGVKIVTIGVTDNTFEYNLSNKVTHYCVGSLKEKLIPKEEFLTHVIMLDFVLFFNSDKYELVPSGVISDCIAFSKPIIAIKTYSLEAYFEKYGDLGYLCEDINSMAKLIEKISCGELDYSKILDNLEKAKKLISTSDNIKVLKKDSK